MEADTRVFDPLFVCQPGSHVRCGSLIILIIDLFNSVVLRVRLNDDPPPPIHVSYGHEIRFQGKAAANIVGNITVTGGSWLKSLAEMTGDSLEDLMPCVEDLHQLYLNAAQHAQQSVRDKYKGPKYLQVSLIDAPQKLLLK